MTEASMRSFANAAAALRIPSMKAALQNAVFYIFAVDRDWRISFANHRMADYVRMEGGLVGRNLWEVFPEAVDAVRNCLHEAFDSRQPMSLSVFGARQGAWLEIHAYPDAADMTVVFRDISALRQAFLDRRQSAERMQLVLDASSDGAWEWDIDRGRITFSEQWCVRHRFADQQTTLDVDGWRALVHPDDVVNVRGSIVAHLKGETDRFEAEYRIRIGEGEWQWNVCRGRIVERELGTGRALRMVGTDTDISAKRKAEERIWWTATHDPLTELPNRRLFQERLSTSIRRAAREGGRVGMLLLDVDHFKEINDSFGHDAGDALLCTFAGRLREVVDTSGTVARLSGDEFAVVLPEMGSDGEIVAVAEAIIDKLSGRFSYKNQTLLPHASVGAAVYGRDAGSAEELMKSADMALYMAKTSGRARLAVFSPEMRADLEKRTSMLCQAQAAIDAGRVEPLYQPQVDLKTGRLVGIAALLRWRDETGRLRLPNEIAAAFEEHELSVALNERMHARIFADMRTWLSQGFDFGHVAFKASPAEFSDDAFAERLIRRLESYDIPADLIEIEVAEGALLCRGGTYVARALAKLSRYGVSITLDGFGTGYSSLAHLKNHPVVAVKIDPSFVRDVETSRADAAIARAMIGLARELGMKVVVEGIERNEQIAFFSGNGVAGQGRHFGEPAPAGEIARRWSGDLRSNVA